MRAPEFEASLHEAKLYPQLWRLLLGVLFIVFIYISTVVPLSVGTVVAMARSMAGEEPMTMFHITAALRTLQTNLAGTGGIATPATVFFALATFAGLFAGPLLAAAAFHFRGPGSVFGPFGDWARGFGTALMVQVPILAAISLVGAWIDPPTANLAFGDWLRYLPLALPLIFLQTGAEEVLFRGYLQQQLAARFAARVIWMGLPALAFALLHWSPAAGPNLPVILLSSFIFGLIAADLTEQTGNLGAAMGLHFGNNFFGMLVVAIANTITGLALYVSPSPLNEFGGMTLAMGISIVIMLVVWWITRRLLTR
ncbi:hypothetical protein CLV78_10323 [Aliiruegeria haliotis]|uniref:CAAX prenyl protease 2/Lysostaphin resistance protein A-like domain-containing protein n=1 Tax=Aliiruegeria haliotis TaxID=1280846 RepID=A0A2T0RSI4_9RHOB|nr:CPBP family intramembrane glutamic endopeptidase [Aliiruegeria haliotis]PRY24159.1 hypothetical protein CLV78_10323 [Aliiruegeria haliotis]